MRRSSGLFLILSSTSATYRREACSECEHASCYLRTAVSEEHQTHLVDPLTRVISVHVLVLRAKVPPLQSGRGEGGLEHFQAGGHARNAQA